MNKYGRMAMRHWAEHAPTRYRAIEDPETFFAHLGDQASEQILNLEAQLAGPDPADETYLGKVGRLNEARRRAEEIVLTDLVWIAAETSENETFEAWMAGPGGSVILQPLRQWAMQIADARTAETDEIIEKPASPEVMAATWELPLEVTRAIWDAPDPTTALAPPEAHLPAGPAYEAIVERTRREWEQQGAPQPQQ